jgi:hypothetical protein
MNFLICCKGSGPACLEPSIPLNFSAWRLLQNCSNPLSLWERKVLKQAYACCFLTCWRIGRLSAGKTWKDRLRPASEQQASACKYRRSVGLRSIAFRVPTDEEGERLKVTCEDVSFKCSMIKPG